VTLDLGLPPYPADVKEGFAALIDMLDYDPLTKVIIITGRGEKEHALKAIGQGAYDFFTTDPDSTSLKSYCAVPSMFLISTVRTSNFRNT
jgi:two-component system NtrC family response regulator